MKKVIISISFALAAFSAAEAKKPEALNYLPVTMQLVSEPADARVYMNGQLISYTTPERVQINCVQNEAANVSKKHLQSAIGQAKRDRSIRLRFEKDGYLSEEVVVEPSVSLTANNKQFNYSWPTVALCKFRRDPRYDRDPTIVDGEAAKMVSRNKPGATALERTVIRWFFDSDPRGARIYWRVVSSIPSIVKNTNDTYLMTTPFEETRSFDIQGLTYENSRDVQIEIKVSKRGYEDQIKRFNVRQAIDQQEISGFFEMVPKEE